LVGPSLFSAWVTVFSWEIVPIEFDPIDDVPASCCLTIAHALVVKGSCGTKGGKGGYGKGSRKGKDFEVKGSWERGYSGTKGGKAGYGNGSRKGTWERGIAARAG